ncbi:unnamed protein product [Rotaria magnacalcarata]|uniref:Uncharacterized protein n=1 Tax=Rotaria magnacalcarata TaxID=392030 RepID=A0A816F4A1_9BILA|nr:unnamed protein product [Rotaria magnacalcarata]CAF2231242.1 unnamed protein product [Rotaria magnacalcarata]
MTHSGHSWPTDRASSHLYQIFQLNIPADLLNIKYFIEPIQITDYQLNIDNLVVSQQSSRLAFDCQIYPNLSIKETVIQQHIEQTSDHLVYKVDKLCTKLINCVQS